MRRPSLGLLVLLSGCGSGGGTADAPPIVIDAPVIDAPPVDADPGPGEDFDIPTTTNPDLDVLFVVDNSGSMIEEQQTLVANFPVFINVLDQLSGGLPNLHLGVVTSDMGTLGVSIGDPSCSDSDNGNLVKGNPDLANQCTQVTGNFISDVSDGVGGRFKNYTGTLADAFSCVAAVGNNGCGFEQHLESMHAALNNNPVNATFIRPSARLAVIIIADEDDCSAAMPGFFGPDGPELGPIDSFRCFEKAIACNEGSDVTLRDKGVKTGCHVDDSQDYLHDVGEYVTFLRTYKADPLDVIVAGFVGSTEPVEVGRRTPTGSTMPRPDLIPSCSYTDGVGMINTADPAIRLATFFTGFPDRNAFTTICNDDYTDGLVAIAELLRSLVGYACVEQVPADADDDPSNGLQPDCEFAYVIDEGEPTEQRVDLPACDDGLTNQPCWHLVDDLASCPDTPTHLAVVVEHMFVPPPETHIVGRCRI